MMGKALHAACAASRVNDRLQESIYLLLELLRAGVVHGGRWGGADAEILSGGPSFGSEEEQSSALLIMRVLSVLPLSFRVSTFRCSICADPLSPPNGLVLFQGSCWFSTRLSGPYLRA
jgi:hypothetical protein